MSSFPLFTRLPPEIRLSIWLLAIPADASEVCLPWPGGLPRSASHANRAQPFHFLPALPLTVDTGFPSVMHACREARAVVRDTRRSGVRFRPSRRACCMVPFRVFCPETDVLFLDMQAVEHLDLLYRFDGARLNTEVRRKRTPEETRVVEGFIDVLRRVKRLAVPILQATTRVNVHFDTVAAIAQVYFSGAIGGPLEQLSLVFPCSSAYGGVDGADADDHENQDHYGTSHPDSIPVTRGGCRGVLFPKWFTPPERRCRLITAPALQSNQDVLVACAARGCPTSTAAAAVAKARKVLAETLRPVAGEQALAALRVTTDVFVEHQRDGTWREVCRERQYSNRHQLLFVPVKFRPNPEMVRVQDNEANPYLRRGPRPIYP